MVRTHIRPLSALTLVAALASGAVLPSQTRIAGMDALIRSTNSAQSFTGVPAHFLAGLPLLPARAQTPPTVTLTVNLEITTPVPPTDTFSAFIGASDKPVEVVLCGTGRGEGRITYCTAGLTITQRTPIFTAGAVPYRFVHFSGPFRTRQRGSTFARGTVTLTRNAKISATYPSAAGTRCRRA